MGTELARATSVLDRILSSYGFTTQKELSEHLEIARNSISGWLQRDSIPSSVIVKCNLDTGADVNWLLNGQFEKASCDKAQEAVEMQKIKFDGQTHFKEVQASGGKAVLERMLEAYGFTMQKELGDLMGLSSGTISTWIRRDYFPGDAVVTCALDTGASLRWLATGEGNMHPKSDNQNSNREEEQTEFIEVKSQKLLDGTLIDIGTTRLDNKIFKMVNSNDVCVTDSNNTYLVDFTNTTLGDGIRLIDIDGFKTFYSVIRKPGNRLILRNGNNSNSSDIECDANSVKSVGSIKHTIIHNIR